MKKRALLYVAGGVCARVFVGALLDSPGRPDGNMAILALMLAIVFIVLGFEKGKE